MTSLITNSKETNSFIGNYWLVLWNIKIKSNFEYQIFIQTVIYSLF